MSGAGGSSSNTILKSKAGSGAVDRRSCRFAGKSESGQRMDVVTGTKRAIFVDGFDFVGSREGDVPGSH